MDQAGGPPTGAGKGYVAGGKPAPKYKAPPAPAPKKTYQPVRFGG